MIIVNIWENSEFTSVSIFMIFLNYYPFLYPITDFQFFLTYFIIVSIWELRNVFNSKYWDFSSNFYFLRLDTLSLLFFLNFIHFFFEYFIGFLYAKSNIKGVFANCGSWHPQLKFQFIFLIFSWSKVSHGISPAFHWSWCFLWSKLYILSTCSVTTTRI